MVSKATKYVTAIMHSGLLVGGRNHGTYEITFIKRWVPDERGGGLS